MVEAASAYLLDEEVELFLAVSQRASLGPPTPKLASVKLLVPRQADCPFPRSAERGRCEPQLGSSAV